VRLSSLLFQGFWNQIGPLPERLQEHFAQSSRYEYLFWEQAYRQEGWPVQEDGKSFFTLPFDALRTVRGGGGPAGPPQRRELQSVTPP